MKCISCVIARLHAELCVLKASGLLRHKVERGVPLPDGIAETL